MLMAPFVVHDNNRFNERDVPKLLADCPVPCLTSPFTITYVAETQDVRSLSLKKQIIQDSIDKWKNELALGILTKDAMSERIDQLKSELYEKRDTDPTVITMSYDGEAFIAQWKVKGKLKTTVILNLDGAFLKSSMPWASVNKFISNDFVSELPLVGSSMPFLPLIKGSQIYNPQLMLPQVPSCKFLRLGYEVGRFVYTTSQSGSTSKATAYYGLPGRQLPEYEIRDIVRFAGGVIGRSLTRRLYELFHGVAILTSKQVFHLQSMRPFALQHKEFMPETYLDNGIEVTVTSSDLQRSSFKFELARGTFKEQVRACIVNLQH